MKSILPLALSVVLLGACSGNNSPSSSGSGADPADQITAVNEVIKARATIYVEPGATDQAVQLNSAQLYNDIEMLKSSGSVPIDIINAPNTTIKFDTSKFKIPAITNAVLNFGTLAISALTDNMLEVCGVDKKSKCTKAFVRFYTTGAKGPGIWNAVGGYGMPVSAIVANKPVLVGLEPDNAAYVVSVTIPATKHVMSLADILPSATYGVTSDFKNAGAGAYYATLVIEYGLAD